LSLITFTSIRLTRRNFSGQKWKWQEHNFAGKDFYLFFETHHNILSDSNPFSVDRRLDCHAILRNHRQNFSTLDVDNLRRQIGYVGQLPVLFNGTVRYNILLGKPDATEEEIISAARAAHCHDFIVNLPHGYDSEVGPGGGMLSGGKGIAP
jgi:ABC-type phosphate transport system ATPase subunit